MSLQTLHPWLMLAIIAAVLAIFALAECLRRYAKTRTEITRKFVHISAGLVTLSFPDLFSSHWSVFLLCTGFLLLLLISRYYHFLDSINAIGRRSLGSLVYPVIIWFCFLVYVQTGDKLSYYLPLLIFIICDPLAAFFGMRTRWLPYRIGKDSKTVAGSLAFFLSAFLLSGLLMMLILHLPLTAILAYSILVAAGATLAEAVSPLGLDNLLVPLSILGILQLVNIPA